MSCRTSSLCTLLLVFSILSCAPKRSEIALDTRQTGVQRLQELVRSAGARLHSLTGRGTISFEAPEMTGSAFFTLSLKKPDSLLVKLEGPFGIDVGTFFLSRERYLLYTTRENRVITGVPDERSIRSLVPFDLTYEQMLDAFSGVFPITGEGAEVERYTVADDQFYLSFRCGNDICEYWVDPSSLLVTKLQRRDAGGRIVLEAEAASLTEQEEVHAPRRITLTFPQVEKRLSVFYSSLTLNDPQPLFGFTIPSSAHTTVR